jgi:hypothetical protein
MTKSLSSPSIDMTHGRRRRLKKEDSLNNDSDERKVVMTKLMEAQPNIQPIQTPLKTVLLLKEIWKIQLKPSIRQPKYAH